MMRKYQVEFILKTEPEDDSVNTYLSIATDKGISAVAEYVDQLLELDGQAILRVHRIADHGSIVVI